LRGKYKIANFADTLKKCLSALLNIPVEKFEDRDFKENWYIDFNTLKIYYKNDVPDNKKLSDKKFSKLAKILDPTLTCYYYLTFRQVLQFFGTNVLRQFLSDTIFINGTFKAIEGPTIIGDLRFRIERDISVQNNCKIVYIQRNICVASNHDSEKQVTEIYDEKLYDYFIDNNGTLKDLFNSLKQMVYGKRD
jgi:hypothetical protein